MRNLKRQYGARILMAILFLAAIVAGVALGAAFDLGKRVSPSGQAPAAAQADSAAAGAPDRALATAKVAASAGEIPVSANASQPSAMRVRQSGGNSAQPALAAAALEVSGQLPSVQANQPDGGAQSPISPDLQVYRQLEAGKKMLRPRTVEKTAHPTIYLTFDDGPSNLTPQVLDILKQKQVHGTFFMIGENAERYPDTVRDVLKQGNEIGNHTYDHVYKELYPDFQHYWDQIRRTDAILAKITGTHPKLLRAPGGTFENYDAFYFYLLDQAGYRVIDWNIDSGDSARPGVPASEIIQTAEKGPYYHDIVLLMHDGAGHSESVKALPAIIDFYKSKGYAFSVLSDNLKDFSFRLSEKQRPHKVTYDQFGHYLSEVTGRPLPAGFDALAAKIDGGAAGSAGSPGASSGTSGAADASMGTDAGSGVSGKAGNGGSGSADTGDAASGNTHGASGTAMSKPSGGSGQNGDSGNAQGPLNVKVDGKTLAFPGGGYVYEQGTLYIPLREFFTQLGGKVEWLDSSQTAQADYRGRTYRCDPSSGRIGVAVAGASGETAVAGPILMRHGILYAGLRNTASAMGERVAGYTQLASGWKVELEPAPAN